MMLASPPGSSLHGREPGDEAKHDVRHSFLNRGEKRSVSLLADTIQLMKCNELKRDVEVIVV